YAATQPPLWIDPSNEYARAGELPFWDRGRQALVADAATRGLQRTPEIVPGANRVVESREFWLAERGPSRLVEVTDYFGAPERNMRHTWAFADATKADDAMNNYVRSEYAAPGLTRFEHSDARSLEQPFHI